MDSVKNHHLNMDILKEVFDKPEKKVFCKAHSVANKCMANMVGEAMSKDELVIPIGY
jgi:hypothetical protein